MRHPSLLVSLSVLVGLVPLACGGSPPPAEAPESSVKDTSDDYDPTRNIGATAEVGALPEEESIAAFRGSFEPIQDCFVQGAKRIEFLGGSIAFNIVVGSNGQVKNIFAEQSTLGDRETEMCMFRVLRNADWPKPVGGLIGVAQNGFEFEMTGDVRPPVEWDDFDPDSALRDHSTDIRQCKGPETATYTATVYVDTDGSAISAGISAPDKGAENASDCLVGVLKGATYPSPGSWPAKVTFSL